MGRSEAATTGLVYDLTGTVLEARPAGGAAQSRPYDSVVVYRFHDATVQGVDVSGLTLVQLVQRIPGGGRVVRFVDDQASDVQLKALLDAYRGRLGGPLADPTLLVGEEVAVERVPIVHDAGTVRIGDCLEVAPLMEGDSGTGRYGVDLAHYGIVWSLEHAKVVQSDYRVTHPPHRAGRRDLAIAADEA